MTKQTKVWLMIAALLIAVGLLLLFGTISAKPWALNKPGAAAYETSEHPIADNFRNISIDTDTADISFAASEDGSCNVVCFEEKSVKHAVFVQNDTLFIHWADERAWYEKIGIFHEAPSITVFLPAAAYDALTIQEHTGDIRLPGDLRFETIAVTTSTGDVENYACTSGDIRISTDTGDIQVKNITASNLVLSVSTGKVTAEGIRCTGDILLTVDTGDAWLTDAACNAFLSDGNTGNLSLQNVIAKARFSIERSTGDVKFDSCDAKELLITTDTGDVMGTLLSDKVFMIESDTGRVDVPSTTTGGRCEITTDTGDIRLQTETLQ